MDELGYIIEVDRWSSGLGPLARKTLSATLYIGGAGEPIEVVPRLERELTGFEWAALRRRPGGWVGYLVEEAIGEGAGNWTAREVQMMKAAKIHNLHRRRGLDRAASYVAGLVLMAGAAFAVVSGCHADRAQEQASPVEVGPAEVRGYDAASVLRAFERRESLDRPRVAALFRRAEELRLAAAIPWALRYHGHGPVDPQGRENAAWRACDSYLESWPDDVVGEAVDRYATTEAEALELRARLLNRAAR